MTSNGDIDPPTELSNVRITEQQQLQLQVLQPAPTPINFLDTFPMGYRFNPTDSELLRYLNIRVEKQELPPNNFNEVNLYDHHPKYLTAEGVFKAYEKKEWYFFTPRDRKYRNGDRPKRAASTGYWKATGVDKVILWDDERKEKLGSKKTLVFYEGKPPLGQKSDFVMHEFKVDKSSIKKGSRLDMRLDDCVLCRIHIKKTKNYSGSSRKRKAVSSPDGKEENEVQKRLNGLRIGNLQQRGNLPPLKGLNVGNLQKDGHLLPPLKDGSDGWNVGNLQQDGHPMPALKDGSNVGNMQQDGHPLQQLNAGSDVGNMQQDGHPLPPLHIGLNVGNMQQDGHPLPPLHNGSNVGNMQQDGHPLPPLHNGSNVGNMQQDGSNVGNMQQDGHPLPPLHIGSNVGNMQQDGHPLPPLNDGSDVGNLQQYGHPVPLNAGSNLQQDGHLLPMNDGSNVGNMQQDGYPLPLNYGSNMQQDGYSVPMNDGSNLQQYEDGLLARFINSYNNEDAQHLGSNNSFTLMMNQYYPTDDLAILNNNSSLIMGGHEVQPLQTCLPDNRWITPPNLHNEYDMNANGTAATDMVSDSAMHNTQLQGFDQNQEQWQYNDLMSINSSVPAALPLPFYPQQEQVNFQSLLDEEQHGYDDEHRRELEMVFKEYYNGNEEEHRGYFGGENEDSCYQWDNILNDDATVPNCGDWNLV